MTRIEKSDKVACLDLKGSRSKRIETTIKEDFLAYEMDRFYSSPISKEWLGNDDYINTLLTRFDFDNVSYDAIYEAANHDITNSELEEIERTLLAAVQYHPFDTTQQTKILNFGYNKDGEHIVWEDFHVMQSEVSLHTMENYNRTVLEKIESFQMFSKIYSMQDGQILGFVYREINSILCPCGENEGHPVAVVVERIFTPPLEHLPLLIEVEMNMYYVPLQYQIWNQFLYPSAICVNGQNGQLFLSKRVALLEEEAFFDIVVHSYLERGKYKTIMCHPRSCKERSMAYYGPKILKKIESFSKASLNQLTCSCNSSYSIKSLELEKAVQPELVQIETKNKDSLNYIFLGEAVLMVEVIKAKITEIVLQTGEMNSLKETFFLQNFKEIDESLFKSIMLGHVKDIYDVYQLCVENLL